MARSRTAPALAVTSFVAVFSGGACRPLDAFAGPCVGAGCAADRAGDDRFDSADEAPGDGDLGGEKGPPGPPEGCADLTREGFQALDAFPDIAACGGGFSVPGVLRSDMAPTCDRGAGNSAASPDGAGCAAVDLCAGGWHVCRGAAEVLLRAPDGCAQAVPALTADQMLFFATAQHSEGALECNTTTGDNDVFGCGNLGVVLSPTGSCAPLNRALASTTAGACGWNQAEPPLGPWQCQGGVDSHLHEAAIITTTGCPGQSCSWDSRSIGNSDKGGVLCCRD
ncbi:MAG: hypothetical protein HY903_17335 [Deltaproteobacteria bacterium]|nr:hypothetical protein [Deltaproteobacteria bacterium]